MEPFPIPSDRQLLQTIIEPLLEDFIYWFEKSEAMLNSQRLNFMAEEDQAAMMAQLQEQKKQVYATQSLLKAMDSAVIVEPSQVQKWHGTVQQCWSIALKFRSENNPTTTPDQN